MPAKYIEKSDRNNMYYHVFNRGANQDEVFSRKEDYWFFRSFIKQARRKSGGLIKIDTFAILPTHFHLLIYQAEAGAMEAFMRSLGTKFSLYINGTRDHQGKVFESVYKAKMLPRKIDVRRTREYILNNPLEFDLFDWKHVGHVV